MARKLFADILGITKPLVVSVNNSHNNATAIATITAEGTSMDIGDPISIDLGFTDDHANIFNGWVKGVDRQVPEDVYTITAQDKLVQAIDYFIVSASPDAPYNYGKGISAEDLVDKVLTLADVPLTHSCIDPTFFTFGVNNDVEVNLVSSYDYAKMIADIVTWGIWCDRAGNIHFENRKPFVMGADPGQPGWDADTPINADPYTDVIIIDNTYKRTEKELRNRVVVYGEGGIKADKKRADSYDPFDDSYKQILPVGFYKSVVCSYGFIGTQAIADDIAQYNLDKLNKITEQVAVTMEGKPELEARIVIRLKEDITEIPNSLWYTYSVDHAWSKDGYVCMMDLRR